MYNFKMIRGNAILNFSNEYCKSRCELIESEPFLRVLTSYIKECAMKEDLVFDYLKDAIHDQNQVVEDLRLVFKLLLFMPVEQLLEIYPKYVLYFRNRDEFVRIVEEVYLYWRKLQRFSVVFNEKDSKGYQNVQFSDAQTNFEALVLNVYRTIEETALGYHHRVYRQVTAGVNAGLRVSHIQSFLPYDYRKLDSIPFIDTIIIHPPFITYSKRNTRDGVFKEVYHNPISELDFNADDWFCYPAKVGKELAYIYFHNAYMAQGVTLCNLFELASDEMYALNKPDLIYVFGFEDNNNDQVFYQDNVNNMIVAKLSASDDIDYFGYMKKMILTMHNVKQINQRALPIHGAMVNITLYNGVQKNIIIMGDSGAGKSETIEQIKAQGLCEIKNIITVYDDMGVLSLDENGIIKSSGSEIGAFVRLDDLDAGYSFKELDRSVFMNPDKVNARIVIPITNYRDIIFDHHVDYFLYANNYQPVENDVISYFDNAQDAIDVFKKGARKAKGTTTETGIVESYFANPFGPFQRQKQTDILLEEYFKRMFDQGIKVGQIKTQLGISGFEYSGPKLAAKELLLEILKK